MCKNNEYSQAEIVASNSNSMGIYSHLAEKYLQKADLSKAENAFIKSGEYRGVQLIKKLEKISVIIEFNSRIPLKSVLKSLHTWETMTRLRDYISALTGKI